MKKKIKSNKFSSNSIKKIKEKSVKSILFITSVSAIFIVFAIIIFLLKDAFPFLTEVNLIEFFTNTKWAPTGTRIPSYGALPLIIGSILITIGAMVIAIPLSIGSAIFISELAPSWLKKILKPAVELLAGVPSVIYGYFGVIFLVPWIMTTFNQPTGMSWLAASILLGIMAIPTITSVAEDAISSVPREYKEGSLAVGANKWETISKVVIPSAISGITAAVILGIGRAIGETIAVSMVAGSPPYGNIPDPLFDVFARLKTLTSTIVGEAPEVTLGSTHYHGLFALAVILLLIALLINLSATFILGRLKEKHLASDRKKSSSLDFITKRLRRNTIFYVKIIKVLIVLFLIYLIFTFFNILTATIIVTVIILLFIINRKFKLIFSIKKYLRIHKLLDHKQYIKIIIVYIIIIYFLFSIFNLVTASGLLIFVILFSIINKRAKRKHLQKIWFSIMALCMIAVLIFLGLIIYYIVSNGIGVLNWEFISSMPAKSGTAGGILPAIIGTLLLVIGAVAIALPLGLGAAIYLNEYQKEGKITKFIRTAVDLLNGTPSIVFGLFGMAFLVYYLGWGFSLIAGCVTLAFMILPTIIRTSEEALKSVPQNMREGSYAVGASKWQTIRKVVLPPAAPGIITGTILGIGRAAGETAPVILVCGTLTQKGIFPDSIFSQVNSLTFYLYNLKRYVPGTENTTSGIALVLLLLIIGIYLIAIVIRNYYNKKMKW